MSEAELFIAIGAGLGLTYLLGQLFEKVHIPWIFAALFVGISYGAIIPQLSDSITFTILAELGMYFLLFIVGYELDIKSLAKHGGFIIKSSFLIILGEALVGSLLLHGVFGYGWTISLLVGVSFATVGEAILVPILDKFKLMNRPLGQMIIGIGTIDDIFEILSLVFLAFLVGTGTAVEVFRTLLLLGLLLTMSYGLIYIKKRGLRLNFGDIESLFVFVLAILLVFVGIGLTAGAAPLAALLAGVSIRYFIPDERLAMFESDLKSISYGFFAIIFFIWAGLSIDLNHIGDNILLIIAIMIITSATKIILSIITAKSQLGVKQSILLGIGLSARFSTSIVILKVLLENNLIEEDLYSILLGASILFTIVVPITFSLLSRKWLLSSETA